MEDGDIVNVDITVYLDGYHGDTSDTFPVGNVVRSGLHIQKNTVNLECYLRMNLVADLLG